jgi:hypothetical protein
MRATPVQGAPGCHARARVILILGALPGIPDLIQAGFVRALSEARLELDLQLVDLELNHLTDRSALTKLRTRLIPQARAAGCDREVWPFIRQPPAGSPPMRQGVGSADRFASAHRPMARSLPAAQVTGVPGAHDWPVWLQLWRTMLPRLVAELALVS